MKRSSFREDVTERDEAVRYSLRRGEMDVEELSNDEQEHAAK
ncbi:MAG TPA: hypothetical protein VFZ23_16500 [Pyrinomonadaceae bacterium]